MDDANLAVAPRHARDAGSEWPSKTAVLVSVALLANGTVGAVVVATSNFGWIWSATSVLLIAIGAIGAARIWLPRSVAIPALVFLYLAILGAVVSYFEGSRDFALFGWMGLVSAPGGALAVAYACRLGPPGRQRASRRLLLGVVLVVAVGNAFWALRQSLQGFTRAEIVSADSADSTYLVGDQMRSMGLFLTNQEFGVFGACVVPALVALALRSKRRQAMYATAAALLYVAVLLSLTRTAILAATVGTVIVILLWSPGRTVITRLLAGGLVVALSGGFAYWLLAQSTDRRVQDALERISTMLDLEGDASAIARQGVVYPRAIGLILEHPLGLGAGSAGPVSQRFPDVAPVGAVITDNGFLMVGVQLGVLGVLCFAWMLIALAFWLGRARWPESVAGAATLVSLLIAMIVAQYWSLWGPMSLLAGIVGVGIAAAQEPARALYSRDGRGRRAIVGVPRGRVMG